MTRHTCLSTTCLRGNCTGGVLDALDHLAQQIAARHPGITDDQAVMIGVTAHELTIETDWTDWRVRLHLKRHMAAGRVLCCQRVASTGSDRWWPVGLCAAINTREAA